MKWVAERWGIGSTRLHLDLQQLALAVLLFDRVVLPTPSSEAEADRWDRLGWDTETQALRVVQLGELVYFAPWDKTLHIEMRDRWRELGAEVRDLGYAITPEIIAKKAWDDVMASVDNAGFLRIKPIPVAWYGNDADAAQELRMRRIDDGERVPQRPTEPYEEVVAVEFTRVLQHPLSENAEAAFDVAYKLSTDTDFCVARRALYQWEAEVAAAQLALEDAAGRLQELVADYNDIVVTYAGTTSRRVVHSVLPHALGFAAERLPLPGLSELTGWSTKQVLARLMPLPPQPEPALSPGASMVLAQRAMSAMFLGD